jgi:hypothetical protein
MKRWWIMKGIKMVLLFIVVGSLMTYLVMSLWNWLMPSLFQLGMISFWQALGILLLTKLLFGFGRGGWHGHRSNQWQGTPMWKQKMGERLKHMTPEEREKFREEWKSRCGRWGSYPFDEQTKDEQNMSAS